MPRSLRDRRKRSPPKVEDDEMLKPVYDKTFKHLFGDQKNSSISKKLISDVTGLIIDEITYVDPYLPPEVNKESKRIVDILWKLPSGEKVLVEIQRARQQNFSDRILYYASKIYASNLKTGDKTYCSLKKVYLIVISEEGMKNDGSEYSSIHRILDVKSHNCFIDGLSFYLLDLSKFPFKKNEVDKITSPIDVWMFFLKYINELSEAEVNEFMKRNPFMADPINVLKLFKLSQLEKLMYDFELRLPFDIVIEEKRRALEENLELEKQLRLAKARENKLRARENKLRRRLEALTSKKGNKKRTLSNRHKTNRIITKKT